MQTNISRIYHSREDRIAELHDGNERLNYDGKDHRRAEECANVLEEYSNKCCEALDAYAEAAGDADQNQDELDYARRHAIECWSLAQAALSKVAWVMRFDGNKAYERMINALRTGAAADMRGL
jgi:hypothetical protein